MAVESHCSNQALFSSLLSLNRPTGPHIWLARSGFHPHELPKRLVAKLYVCFLYTKSNLINFQESTILLLLRPIVGAFSLRYSYKLGHKLQNGTFIWSKSYYFKSSPYPGQESLQRVVIFGDMGKVCQEN